MSANLIKSNGMKTGVQSIMQQPSLSFKMISVFFIVFLNAAQLFSQPIAGNNNNRKYADHYGNRVYNRSEIMEMLKSHKAYTVLIAKSFPTLENQNKQTLICKDDSEFFDYNAIFFQTAIEPATGTHVSKPLQAYTNQISF